MARYMVEWMGQACDKKKKKKNSQGKSKKERNKNTIKKTRRTFQTEPTISLADHCLAK